MGTGEKILVRGVNWLGDAVMTTPALQRLREHRPGAHIALLTHEKLADLWRTHPSVDTVITFREGEGTLAVARRLRAERFDTAVVLPNSLRSALETFLARIPERVGHARGLLLTRPLPRRAEARAMHKRSAREIGRRIAGGAARETFPPAAHHIHDYLHIVATLGANPAPLPPLLQVSDAEVQGARETLTGSASAGPPVFFGLNPGAEYGPAKRWPAEYFAAAARHIHEQTGCVWLGFGGERDRPLLDEIARDAGGAVTNLAGRTTLRQLMAMARLCRLVLTNDTGPMHLAAALGTPVVVPFGSTAPELTGPWSAADGPHRLQIGDAPCAPCFRRACPVDFRCMRSVSVERVVDAVLRVADGTPE